MKLLLCVASVEYIQPVLQQFSVTTSPHPSLAFIQQAKILQHEVDILETGVGVFQTTYRLTKALSLQKYHLALRIGMGNSYKTETAIGTVLNIVNEKPGDYGMSINGEWKDLYDLNLIKPEDQPQQRGGFINLTNSYMNVFMPFKKVVGLTVNNYADKSSFASKKVKYKADCETADGIGFAYTCLYEKQNFYHLCIVERNLETGEENSVLAKDKMNELIIDLIQKI